MAPLLPRLWCSNLSADLLIRLPPCFPRLSHGKIYLTVENSLSHSQRIPPLGNTSAVTRHMSRSQNIYFTGMRWLSVTHKDRRLIPFPSRWFCPQTTTTTRSSYLTSLWSGAGPHFVLTAPLTAICLGTPNHSVTTGSSFEFVLSPSTYGMFFFKLTHPD